MAEFILYLLKSGICLTILYVGYVLFFNKETYFNFNRGYLLMALIFSLVSPLLNIDIKKKQTGRLYHSIETLVDFTDQYESALRVTPLAPTQEPAEVKLTQSPTRNNNKPLNANIALVYKIIFYAYLFGAFFFSVRFLYLLAWLGLLIRKNDVVEFEGYKLVQTKKDMPTFSFMKYIFINRNKFSEYELKQILEHEKAHINQWHSIDLLLMHLVIILQWFNPVIWKIKSAFKTTHEYIADKKVVESGYEILDYQSLLLRQLVSTHSVELVNNFSLLPVKKRIAMMNRNSSVKKANIKRLLFAPLLLCVPVLFSDFSLNYQLSKQPTRKFPIKIDLPEAALYKKVYHNELSFPIYLNSDSILVGNRIGELGKLEPLLEKEKLLRDKSQQNKITVRLVVDKDVEMARVTSVKQELRKLNLLKIAYVISPVNKENAVEENWSYARLRKLPPMDGIEIIKIVP